MNLFLCLFTFANMLVEERNRMKQIGQMDAEISPSMVIFPQKVKDVFHSPDHPLHGKFEFLPSVIPNQVPTDGKPITQPVI